VDTGAIPPANKISTMLFLAVVLSYLQKSSELFDAIEKKSRGNADIAKLANDLLHKAQNLNTMMSNLSNKVKTLASDLQVVAGKFGIINGSTTLTEQNLGLYDLMFIERATKGEAPGFGTLTREQALTELFLLKFDPSLSQDTCNEIKNYKPPEDHPNDTYFSAIDKDTKRPVHENVASTFNGAYMWDNVTRNGQTVTWRDKQYSGSISVSFFGDAFNSWIETADRGLIKKNDTIALSDFNDLVNKYFANFPTIGFPKSNFTLFDTSKYMGKENSSIIDITTTDVAKSAPDFFRGITSMVSSYSTNLGQHQITELQQKVANSGKESQDDWAKAIEQIQKFTDAGTQAFNAFAKAC
jgi:hypothetical protein